MTEPSQFNELSVKQLKSLLQAKCASYSEKKREIVSKLMVSVSEKPQLVKLVKDHVEPSEIDALLLKASSMPAPSSSSVSSSSKKQQRERAEKAKAALDQQSLPSPELLRKQAREMSRNPDMVRRANPQFRNMTDAQIREQAKEMEKMANNPAALREMMRMQNMPDEEKKGLQRLQEGLQGQCPRDEKWIDDTIKTVKSNPNVLKMMFKGRVPPEAGISEEQIMGFIDFVVSLSDWILKLAIQVINWCIEISGPVGTAYKKADDMTLGCAKYLLMALAAMMVWYSTRHMWYILSMLFGLVMTGYRSITGTASPQGSATMGSASTGAGADSSGKGSREFEEF